MASTCPVSHVSLVTSAFFHYLLSSWSFSPSAQPPTEGPGQLMHVLGAAGRARFFSAEVCCSIRDRAGHPKGRCGREPAKEDPPNLKVQSLCHFSFSEALVSNISNTWTKPIGFLLFTK